MKNSRTKSLFGFTLVEIMITVAIIGFLAAIAIPNFLKSRASSQANTCINTLRQIDAAVQQFTFAANKRPGDTINYPDDLTAYIKLNSQDQIPSCPASGIYSLLPVGTIPSVLCSLGTTVSPGHLLP